MIFIVVHKDEVVKGELAIVHVSQTLVRKEKKAARVSKNEEKTKNFFFAYCSAMFM